MSLPIEGATLPVTGMRSYRYKRSETHLHRGIDLPAPEGTPVLATAPGIVRVANHKREPGFTGYGKVVVLEHPTTPPTWTLSAHLAEVLVEPGERVSAGQAIGTVGRTKFSEPPSYSNTFGASGAHLHFEASARPYPMAAEAERLDPVAWLTGTGDRTQPLEPSNEPSELTTDPAVTALGWNLPLVLGGLYMLGKGLKLWR